MKKKSWWSLFTFLFGLLIISGISCKKSEDLRPVEYTYYEVGFKANHQDWRDTAYIVRTANQQLIQQIEAQLALPVAERSIVVGALAPGSGGYNKNGPHEFKWHLKEDDWTLTEVTIEIYDGRPYSDVDLDYAYWMNTVKRFGAWSSYIKRKLPGKQ